MSTSCLLALALLLPAAMTVPASAAAEIDRETLDRWAAPFRGWHYHPDHVIPARPNIPGYEAFHNTDVPCVYQLPGQPGKWYMSFIAFDGKGYNSFVAESTNLVDWTRGRLAMGFGPTNEFDHGGCVVGAFLYESYDLKAPRLLKRRDGRYWTLYGCYPRQGGYELRPGYEGVAVSDDGLTWRRAKNAPILSVHDPDCGPWEKDCIYQPWLVEDRGRFYNFYNAANGGIEQTGIAFSTDLLQWSRHSANPVIRNRAGGYDEQFASDPKVFRDGDHWIMLYFGVGRGGAHVMAAFSRDLTDWTAHPEPLYQAGGNPSGLDKQYAHKISLVYNPDDDTFYLYYCACGNQGRGIGLITSRPLNRGPSGQGLPGGAAVDPVNAVTPPVQAQGYPSRDPTLDALPGFRNPPPGYGEVPFWWWTGDPLDEQRLLWQLDELHRQGVSGVQVNYAHEDSPGWPTYAMEPPLFSDAWWRVWGRVADACRQRGMGIGLSTYTLDWTAAPNLFRQLFYTRTELNALRLNPPARQRVQGGQPARVTVPANAIGARAYHVIDGRLEPGGVDLMPLARDGAIPWNAPAGEWEVCVFAAEPQPNTLNPLLAGIGEIVVRDFYQRFQDATPNRSPEGLNYFFNDELNVGAGLQAWTRDFAAEFKQRKGYDVFEVLPALWGDLGPVTPKARMDFADVRMALMEERYFQPIYRWHASRGLIFGCDSSGRGLQPDEFGDYFRATRWYSAPGHDTPGGHADLIKGKVSSSIANLYRRPRVWLEGYHSLGWGAAPERLMFATRENYLYGCTLLNLHGLYYTTHGSFWEWAPPCYHFRMPYWNHMGAFLKYFERLSYLLSQGALVADVAVLYPVAPFEAGLDGGQATQTAFDTARALMSAGVNFEFLDADSLARAVIRDGCLAVSDSSYRALIFPGMEAVRWSSLEKAAAFAQAGGLVLNVGKVPFASDRAGREDRELDTLVDATFPQAKRLAKPADAPPVVLNAFAPDTRAARPVRSLHRRVGPREVYYVMDAPKGSTVEFRAKGRAEWWDPWTGAVHPLRVPGETPTGTRVEMPLEEYEAQVIVFSPGPPIPLAASQPATLNAQLSLSGDWEFELQPTMDNRHGDFRLPAADRVIGPEARVFRHALEAGDASAWRTTAFDDRTWERVTYDFGPQFWLLGPLPAAAPEAELAALTRLNPEQPVMIGGNQYHWRPYRFSWRQGLEGDPGHQGWHGLKGHVTDHFICLGKRGEAMNEITYGPEPEGNYYYLWTSATVARDTRARILASASREGPKPHASEVLTPATVFLNGDRVADLSQAVWLRAGANPLLVRFDRAGRGYFVLKRDGADAPRTPRTPLAMTWFDDPAVIRLDVYAGVPPAEWFRFGAPPGFRGMNVTARGTVEAWADGQPMRRGDGGHFEAAVPLEPAAAVALRVKPEVGVSGAAVFPEPIRLECGQGRVEPGDWSKLGALECYSGGAWYRKTVSLTAEQVAGGAELDLGKLVATAEVRVNGLLAGIRVAPPWRVDISKQVKAGDNRIEVLIYNTLANHYLTVPTRYRGEPTSGLLGPVTLRVAR